MPGQSYTTCRHWWRSIYCTRTGIVRAPVMSEAQAMPWRAYSTIRCFLQCVGTAVTRSGAMSASHWPCSHGSVQKRNVEPLPRLNCTDALKKVIVSLSSPTDRVVQGWHGSVHYNQSQRTLSAMPRSLRSSTPSPPKCRGTEPGPRLLNTSLSAPCPTLSKGMPS
jgi:hypothetical protein